MKASINWLKEFVAFSNPPEEIAEMLTMTGLEVEDVEGRDGDTIIEVNVTPNRGDCLSIIGIAREISAILSIPLKEHSLHIETHPLYIPFNVNIENPELCNRYAACIVEGVEVRPSPDWLARRLEEHDIRPVNNIVDITNYVLLEMGQPLHAFDLDRLSGDMISVRRAGKEMEFITLDGVKRDIKENDLMIWDGSKPIAIAGVMGGMNSEVTNSTKNIIIESAAFCPTSIRKTARRLKLKTEASYRFERGIDIEAVTRALKRAVYMITMDVGTSKPYELIDVYPLPYNPTIIDLSLNRIKDKIGIDVIEDEVEDILLRLGFKTKNIPNKLRVIVPSYRGDVLEEIDLIEEVARIKGYGNIRSEMPLIKLSFEPPDKKEQFIGEIKQCMSMLGYSEVINYS
ncbi:MAG: phenylalanine--tRNA ligase subunit beta, partial [Nitrospirae bacterium]